MIVTQLIASGLFAWAVVAAMGIAGLLAASTVAFTVVKLAGAAYLVLLGIRAPLAYRQGLVTNLLNPKVAVFFTALLPQFLPTTATVADHLLLAMVAAAVSLTWFVLLTNVVSAVRRFLALGGHIAIQ